MMLSIRKRAPAACSDAVRRTMQAVGSQDTSPELQLRSALHRLGLRFRKDAKPVPELRCKADVVFRTARVCVFVDGCFWHGCPRHFRVPKTNSIWWKEKIQDNMRRDARQTRALRARGWRVIRFWEHDLTADLERSVERVHTAVTEARR